MRTVTYRLADLEKKVSIHIGRLGENEVTRVQIDAGSLFAEYPDAVASMSVENPEGVKYPATVTRDGDMVIWDVRDSDLAKAGHGEIQWTFTENGAIIKSAIARTSIGRSIVGDGEAPDPLEDWIEHAEDVLEQVDGAFPKGGSAGQVLAKKSGADYDTEWVNQGSGGTGDYEELENLPKIGGVELKGDKSLSDLGAAAESDIPDVSGFYTKPGSGIPASDLADGVIPDVSGFYTKPGTGIPASDLAAGVIPDVSGFYTKPSSGIPASDIADGVIPDPEDLIDDTAGAGDTEKVWSADKSSSLLRAISAMDTATASDVNKALSPKTVTNGKVTEWQFKPISGGSAVLNYVTPEEYGAKGDGVTDDTQAVQDAVDAGYAVYFASNKTYYLADTVNIDHDCHLFGGENTVIKTKTPQGGKMPNVIFITGTLKKTTSLTSDYTSDAEPLADNCGNRFTLSDMDGIAIGDIMVISASDQYYNYARSYYYLGASLLITDIYDGHIYTADNMPWDISNTENVSVRIFDAPTAIIEGLTFEADLDAISSYRYMVSLYACKNAVVKNCTFKSISNGINMSLCVNTEVDTILLSKAKWDNTITDDSYGIVVDSCNNTIIQKVIATCAQHAISITGSLPTINTYVKYCDLTAECRAPGLDTHEAVYNIVVEDSTLGTACLNGVATLNRCRIINNKRFSNQQMGVSVYGSHNPDWSKIKILNTTFYGTGIHMTQPGVQNPVQPYDHVYGLVEVKDCIGGELRYIATTNQTILSNTINRLVIENWVGVKRIHHESNSGIIKELIIRNTTFVNQYFMSDNNPAHRLVLDGVQKITWHNDAPLLGKLAVNRSTRGERLVLPEGTPIQLSSTDPSAVFRVCGTNLTPDVLDDYIIGNVTGNEGGDLVRTKASDPPVTITKDSSGNIVYTQTNGSNSYCVYPVGMYCATEPALAKISATLKNTGATDGAKYRFYIALVDGQTGKIISRSQYGQVQATAEGAYIEHSVGVLPGWLILPYFYCSTPVNSSVTTLENLSMQIVPWFGNPVTDTEYTAKRMTGDGTILSLPGVNNICCSIDTFTVNVAADLAYNPLW